MQTQGEPQVSPIEGTQLIYVTNTENDIFVLTSSQDHYILLSGRWFKAQSMRGPWQYVPGEQLPADFAKIPASHKKANVLASNGNSAAGVAGASYNPNTGVITGGAAGGVRNGSTGQVAAGAGGFAYNTRTDTGVAVGNNNVYASRDGNVYRYNQSSGVQQRTSNGWESVQRSADRTWVQNQQRARGLGEARTRSFRRR